MREEVSLLRKRILLSILLLVWIDPSYGQDLIGQWQGTVHSAPPYRVVLKVVKDEDQLRASIIWVDQSPEYYPVAILSSSNSTVKFSVFTDYVVFQGSMNSDQDRISGVWQSGGASVKVDLHRASSQESWLVNSASRMIKVESKVSLEVLDWGGKGPPLVFLSGLGNTAHIFDTFAPKFAPEYHVFGVTRRGFGFSSSPAPIPGNYSADQLGDDVLRVIDVLGLKKPVLAGHSIAGEELSSIGSRYPDRIAGLIYLDAGYPYALYPVGTGDPRLDAMEVQKHLSEYLSAQPGVDRGRVIAGLLSEVPLLQAGLERDERADELMPSGLGKHVGSPVAEAIHAGERKYTHLEVPILAIFANPHNPTNYFPRLPKASTAKLVALDQARTDAQVEAFRQLKSARVIVLPNASHYIFSSNEQEVEKAMKEFLSAVNEPKH